MYRAVIFDKDGTLIGLEGLWSRVYRQAALAVAEAFRLRLDLEQALAAIGVVADQIVENSLAARGSVQEVFHGLEPFWQQDREQSGTGSEKEGKERLALEKKTSLAGAFEAAVAACVRENMEHVAVYHEKVPLLLKRLAEEQVILGLVTTDSRENTLEMLRHLGLEAYFSYIGCGDDVHRRTKPWADQGRYFMETFQLEPDRVLMVGDSEYDAWFAEGLGIDFFPVQRPADILNLYHLLK